MCVHTPGVERLFFLAELDSFFINLESPVPIVLGTFQSAQNSGQRKVIHFGSRISMGIFIALRIFTALLRL